MLNTIKLASLAGLVLLAACGGKGNDSQADNGTAAAADNLDASADTSANAVIAENLEAQADALRNSDETLDQPTASSNLTAPAPIEEPATNGL